MRYAHFTVTRKETSNFSIKEIFESANPVGMHFSEERHQVW